MIHQNHKIEALIRLLPELSRALKAADYTGLGNTHYNMPLTQLRTIVLGIEALRAHYVDR